MSWAGGLNHYRIKLKGCTLKICTNEFGSPKIFDKFTAMRNNFSKGYACAIMVNTQADQQSQFVIEHYNILTYRNNQSYTLMRILIFLSVRSNN